MTASIKGAEYPLAKIFSSDFEYVIPSFQRPYAWTEDEAGDLFDDLYDFYTSESDEQYFLGSIVLAETKTKPQFEVIDGQQRLTTLTILFSAIASKLTGENKTDFKKYIIEPGQKFQGLTSKPRVCIREQDNVFFRKYIQELKLEDLSLLDVANLDTEAQVNIVKNARLFISRINDKFDTEDSIVSFGAYLVQRCFLIAVTTPSQQAAFRIFSVLNNRGMSLLATDIIKADIIGAIQSSEAERNKYNRKWEEMENEVGRNGFNDLFGHIRMVFAKVKAKKSMREELCDIFFSGGNGNKIEEVKAAGFIDDILTPYSEAYSIVKNSRYSSSNGADEVNDILRWLNRIDNSDWVPVAMLYYVKHGNDADLLNSFLRRLERLAAYMRATSWDVTHRIERYAKVLSEIETSSNNTFGNAVELTKEEITEFITALDSNIYTMTSKKRNYLILRLDSFVSNAAATYDSKVLTIEHVLPQTVDASSQWAVWWPNQDERDEWVHKIGNLLPLAKRTNSEAQNYDFDKKKEKYFKSKTGVTAYALTTQVLGESTWTPDVVKRRQKNLLDVYKQNWDL